MPEQPNPDGSMASLEPLFYRADRVRLVYWRSASGAKPTVVLAGVIAIVAFVAGLSNLSQPTVLEGPMGDVVPGAAVLVQFGGVLSAFLLLFLAVLLQRRKTVAWYATFTVLPILALFPLFTLQATDVVLSLLVIVELPLLWRNRSRFDQPLGLSALQIASLASIIGAIAYGAVGAWVLRDDFTAIDTIGDSVYYVIVTIATVGYGDITPLTPEAKWFSLSVILLGTGAFTAAIGSLVVPAIESRMASAFGNMTASELTLLDDHILILGHGDITESLVAAFDDEIDVVVVTPESDVASKLNKDDVNVITADPTEEAALEEARIDDARGVVVATRDDARDVMAILAARGANPDIHIVAAANRPSAVEKLKRVGADEVISPMEIAGQLLGQAVLEHTAVDKVLADAGMTEESASDSTE